MLLIRLFIFFLLAWPTRMLDSNADSDARTVLPSCWSQKLPVERDGTLELPTQMQAYARLTTQNGFGLEIDQTGIEKTLRNMPDLPDSPKWMHIKARFKARLRREHAIIRNRPKRTETRHVAKEKYDDVSFEVGALWKNMFVIQMLSGHVRVIDPATDRALQSIRVRTYASEKPVRHDPDMHIQGTLFSSRGQTIMDDCSEIMQMHEGPAGVSSASPDAD